MATDFDALAIRARLGVKRWKPPRPFGDGWSYVNRDQPISILISPDYHDDTDWVHASIAHAYRMPTYDELKHLHQAVFADGWAYQVFAPPSDHVNIHSYALHLFGRLDGKPALPDFTGGSGSI